MLKFELSHFPYDRQSFEIYMQSWSYNIYELNITLYDNPFSMSEYHYFENIQCELYGLEAKIITRETYNVIVQTAVFSGKLVRVGNTLTIAVTVPSVIVAFVGLGYIMLSSDSHERVGFLNSLLLTEIMFLMILSGIVPASQTPPVLSRLILTIAAFLSLITCATVVLVYAKIKCAKRFEQYDKRNM